MSLIESHVFFFFSSRRLHTSCGRDWSSDVCSADLHRAVAAPRQDGDHAGRGRPAHSRRTEGPVRRPTHRRQRRHPPAAAAPPADRSFLGAKMGISTKEIAEVIKERLKDFDESLVATDVGRIVATSDGIAQVYGLQNAMAGELLEFPRDTYGLALNLEEDQV